MKRKVLPQNQSKNPPPPPAVPKSQVSHMTLAAILKSLLDSKFTFHLGGSRAMYKRGAQVTVNEDTDYDFYATYAADVVYFLFDMGFKEVESNYMDDEAVGIYKHRVGIDVVLRKDAEFYRGIFDKIPVDLYVAHLWKRNPTCVRENIKPLFNEMYRLAREKAQHGSNPQDSATSPSGFTSHTDYKKSYWSGADYDDDDFGIKDLGDDLEYD